MAHEYTDNNGTTYVNQNHCRSFQTTLSGALTALVDEVCSEVVLMNKSGAQVTIYDSGFSDSVYGLVLADGESFILRGITNTMQVSANGTGFFQYRTQWFSNSPNR